MTTLGWLIVAGAAVAAALAGYLIMRARRRRAEQTPAGAMQALAKEQRKRGKGTIRGKGEGGSDTLAKDSWSGSDFGGPGI